MEKFKRYLKTFSRLCKSESSVLLDSAHRLFFSLLISLFIVNKEWDVDKIRREEWYLKSIKFCSQWSSVYLFIQGRHLKILLVTQSSMTNLISHAKWKQTNISWLVMLLSIAQDSHLPDSILILIRILIAEFREHTFSTLRLFLHIIVSIEPDKKYLLCFSLLIWLLSILFNLNFSFF